MSGSDEADPRHGTSAGDGHQQKEGAKVASKKKPLARPADVGRALRSVYDDTLREDIPSDLRALLGRLG